jgi:hypothetical protein
MTGSGLLGLILLSMGWLFFLGGLAVNIHALRRALRAKEGERTPSGLGFVPGVVGSLVVFFTVPALMRFGIPVPWPWLWILLPLFLDPYCAGGFLLTAFQRLRGRSTPPGG